MNNYMIHLNKICCHDSPKPIKKCCLGEIIHPITYKLSANWENEIQPTEEMKFSQLRKRNLANWGICWDFFCIFGIILLPLHPTKLVGYEEVQAKNSRQDAPEKTFGSWSCSDWRSEMVRKDNYGITTCQYNSVSGRPCWNVAISQDGRH